ncbi:TetR/AcrR family transcriptional regulator [Pseudonocardia sp. RS010]|uniref:TetR/AcrR family transcriptional regulator n=1 Tax=Pseudonocardia sp. RS010 TaxID=3385979 RepID=UPI00399FFFFC
MVRPRFARLPPAQQQAILRAALDEFAAHGFHDASLNRIIGTAGISKGSMYYYFDGKEDLFAHVTRVEFERLLADVGPVPLPTGPGPDAFWAAVERYYRDSVAQLAARPRLASLVRAWLGASPNPALQRAQQELEGEVMPWVERVVAAGRSCGAVRTDLPSGLLIAVALGMGRAMDTWLMTQPPEDAASPPIGALVGMLRRALEPPV